MVVGEGGGVVVFARRPGTIYPSLYSFGFIHISSAFNISSDVSESYSAMYREHAVYVRLEKSLHFSFVFKQIVNLSVVGTVVLVFLQNSFYITSKKSL